MNNVTKQDSVQKKPTVVITGSSGYLGGRLTKHLTKQGYNVVPASRNRTPIPLQTGPLSSSYLDLTHLDQLSTLVVNADAVLHLAATDYATSETNSDLAQQVNVQGTRNLVKACNKAGVQKFIYFSTCHVYGPLSGYLDEKTPENPKNSYAKTHLEAERIVEQEFMGNSVNLRLSNAVGSPLYVKCGAWKLLTHDIILSALNEKKIILKSKGGQLRNFIPVNDIESLVSHIVENQYYGTLNVANKMNHSIIEMALIVRDRLALKLQKDFELITGPKQEEVTPFELSIKRLTEIPIELNYNLEEEIDSIIDFALQNHLSF